jgi:hypothetical protein
VRRAALILAAVGCREDRGPCALDARPVTIDEAVDTISALPSPVTLTCFLQSLERPLGLELTSDIFSAQPAEGVRSPRIFVRSETLTMSVVPVGEARALLEFGEHDGDPDATVKGELVFPVELPLEPEAPYDRILNATPGFPTSCGVCHGGEQALGDGRYASLPLRPPDDMVVPLEVLLGEHASCDPGVDPERCEMFSALLDHGEVFHDPFPRRYPTFSGP